MSSKEVAIIGAGKIGRGYLADVLGDNGYRLVFVHRGPETADALNRAGEYILFISGKDGLREKRIRNFECLSVERDFDAVVCRLDGAEFICVSVYPGAYASVADQLAAAIRLRIKKGDARPVNAFFFVNKVYTARTMRALIAQRLQTAQEKAFLENNVGLVEALTHRGGYNPTPDMLQRDALSVYSNQGRVMPVGDNFIGPKPDVQEMQPMDRMEGRLVRKVWCSNMRHCTLAAMGHRRGHTFITQCAHDAYIRQCVDNATEEAFLGVGREFGFSQEEMRQSVRIDWPRMQKSTSRDDVRRVAADPLRKLSRDDRYIGPALLCLKHGGNPVFLARGAAYLFLFRNENDDTAVRLQQLVEQEGIGWAIYTVCGLDADMRNEAHLHGLILGAYRELLDHDEDM